MGQESLGQVLNSYRSPSGVKVRVTEGVLSDIVSISVLILIFLMPLYRYSSE